MGAIASVVDGVITNQTTAAEKEKEAAKTSGSSLDKDAFLQLLVAQMKYQDPLEPTSNTEYIAQLATFSELEEMQNLSASMDMSRANSLVGQYVFMNEESGYAEGQVDYVVYQGGKIYLSVNEKLYNIDDLDTVTDPEYLLAIRLADSFAEEVNKFPKKELISTSHVGAIKDLLEVYNNMSSYQKSYIPEDTMKKFKEILEVYEVIKPAEDTKEDTAAGTEGDTTNGTDAGSEGDTVIEA